MSATFISSRRYVIKVQAVEKMEMNPNTIMPLVDLVFTFSKMAVVLIEHNLIREKPNLDFLVSLKGTQRTKRQSVALSAINTHHKLNKMNVYILSPPKITSKAITTLNQNPTTITQQLILARMLGCL